MDWILLVGGALVVIVAMVIVLRWVEDQFHPRGDLW